MRLSLTLTLVLFFYQFGFSQNERILIKGRIAFSETPIKNVNILNKTSNYGAISDEHGEFEIMVKKNDILVISHLEYQSKKIIITEEHLRKRILSIEFIIMTNYLDTVEIKNHNLTRNLYIDTKNNRNDTITKKHDLIKEMMKLAKMPSSKNIENPKKPPMNNVDPIANSGVTLISTGISIKDKENLLRRKLRYKKSFPERLINEFGKGYFTIELKIPKDNIKHFISYCEYRNIEKLYKQHKTMKIIDIFKEESVDYLKIMSRPKIG